MRYGLLLLLVAPLLVSCGGQTLLKRSTWERHLQQVQALEQFSAKGRLAYRKADDGVNANFAWSNNADDFELELSGPFGASAVRIEYLAGKLYLSNQKREEYSDWLNPSELLHRHTGLWLPVDALSSWVTGIPLLDMAYQHRLNEHQYLQELQQDGWTIQYTRYTQVGELALPDRITLTKGEIRIRLVIDRWSI